MGLINHSYQTLLFDLDNTLIDFTQAEALSLQATHGRYFHHNVALDIFIKHYHNINKKLWRQVEAGKLNTAQVKHARFQLLIEKLQLILEHQEIAEHYENGLVDHADWYPGVKETLQQLKNKFQLGIITNGLGYVQQAKFTALEVQQFCECYVVSELVGFAKPDKAIFDLALKQLGATAEKTLMVGDSLASDYAGARNSGLDFCWVNSSNDTLPAKLPPPKYQVSSVTELPALIQSLS